MRLVATHSYCEAVITDGFSNNLSKTTGAINLITAAFPEHPILETCITEDNLCIVVLKKK